MPLTDEDIRLIEGFGTSDGTETDAQRRARIKQSLRDAGFDIPYTDSELLDRISNSSDAKLPGASAEDIFKAGLNSGVNQFIPSSQRASDEGAFNTAKGGKLASLINAYLNKSGNGGRVFRPSTIQQPSESDLFNSLSNAAVGPAPDLLFRDVFNEAFPTLGQGSGPFEKFAQKQAKELEQEFLTGVFKQFEQPGFIDSLRGDYEKLYRQKESGDFNGAGGSIPAFEDYIKNRISGDYRSFLGSQHENVRKAFQLASPDERGQRDQGSLAPPARIL